MARITIKHAPAAAAAIKIVMLLEELEAVEAELSEGNNEREIAVPVPGTAQNTRLETCIAAILLLAYHRMRLAASSCVKTVSEISEASADNV